MLRYLEPHQVDLDPYNNDEGTGRVELDMVKVRGTYTVNIYTINKHNNINALNAYTMFMQYIKSNKRTH